MKKDNNYNVFFEIFAGEYVEIMTDLKVPQSINISEDGSAKEIHVPLIIHGFIMDMDDKYVYLSEDGENIKRAVPSDTIKFIEIIDVKDEMDELIDNIPEPEGGYN